MSRQRPASGPAITLFPFLAVLLCTMGSLLVLLVIFSRRAGDSRATAREAAARARADELQAARDELAWRLEQLTGIRARTAADLARARMQLAGIEEDSRKLADELDGLEREAAALAERRPAAEPDDAELALGELERQLAADRAALAAEREEAAAPAAFAVVPYEGKNGTRRRPLYIECCIDGVFLQPEGIRLGPADFEGPPGPGNPLASALRAAREHIARQPGESGDPGSQPYPLLLVRPSGVMAYYAAREAIQSWGSEFGYQFIDEDWPLTYPPADPSLAAVEERAVAESRRRLAWLARSRPPRPVRPPQLYRAAPTRGGVVADGGPSVLGDQSRFDWTEEAAATGRGPAVASGGDGGSGDVILGGTGGSGEDVGDGDAGSRYAGPSRFYAAAPAGRGVGGDGSGPGAGGPGAGGPGDAPASDGSAAAGGPGTTGSRFSAARDGGSGASGSDVASGGAGGAGGRQAGGATAPAAAGSSGQGGGGGSGPSLPGLVSAGGGGMTGQAAAAADGASASLAGARGSNWASLATADRPIPLTRPIRIQCAAREFRILDDAGGRVARRSATGPGPGPAGAPRVEAIHARVAGWGIAGHRMYWRPELILSETSDGAGRRADLERLLADSGLDTRRRDADDAVRDLPPVERTSSVAPLQRR